MEADQEVADSGAEQLQRNALDLALLEVLQEWSIMNDHSLRNEVLTELDRDVFDLTNPPLFNLVTPAD
jgi:hypothetical protein